MTRLLLALLFAATIKPDLNVRPTSRWTYRCQPAPSLACTFTSTSLGNPSKLVWDFGVVGKPPETRTPRDTTLAQRSITNTWSTPGQYRVRLTVYDSIGGNSYSTQLVTVPKAAPPSTVDTVTVHDTIRVPCLCDTTSKPPVIVPPPPPPTGEAWAELPRTYLDTKLQPTTGKVIPVPVGGDLQAALNAAQPCDAIELANAGTWVGSFILPNKPGACTIVIRPANLTAIPPEGTRINPRTAGRLPLILASSNQGAIATDPGSHHWRIVGLEVSAPSTTQNTGLIRLGSGYELTLAQLPHDIVLDRMYVHGTPGGIVRRAVTLNGAFQAVVDSYISEIHDNGPDSQAILGWNGPGPFKIVNDYLEAASENINWGGGDPTIQGLIPSDIEIRGNHFTKQVAWKGLGFNVKNLFEVKNAQRVLVEGNVFEGNWQEGQGGSAIVLKSVNQSGGCPWCVAKDITFRLNVIRNTGSGFALTGHDVGAQSIMTRVTITDNLVTGIDVAPFNGDGRGFLINNDPIDLTIAHNTVLDASNSAITFGGPDTLPPTRLVFRDNILGGGAYGVKGPGIGTAQALATFMPLGGFTNNLIITADPTGLPAGTAVSLASLAFAADWSLGATSTYRRVPDPGANIPAVLAATKGVVQP